MVRDIVIGMADGLTVPFALAAGLSGVSLGSGVIITAGLAEIAAGSIAMGLGGYLAGRTDIEHFKWERRREEQETIDIPEHEAEEVATIFRSYGLPENEVQTVVKAIRSDRERWIDFMMKFELGLDEPDPRRARNSALTIGLSYVVGGLIPLSPYFWVHTPAQALQISIAVTLVALFVFGYVKGQLTIARPWRSAFQTLFVGGAAGSAAFAIARWIA
jgi:vacuolar iron transporter family protein